MKIKIIKPLIYQYYWHWAEKFESHSFLKFWICIIFGNYLSFLLLSFDGIHRLFYIYGWVSIPDIYVSVHPYSFAIIMTLISAAIFYPLYLREDKIHDIINNEEYDTDEYESLSKWLPVSVGVLFFSIAFMNGYENNEAYLKEEAEEELQRKSEIVVGPGAYDPNDPYNLNAEDDDSLYEAEGAEGEP